MVPFELVVPHDEVLNVCDTVVGGGWVKFTGALPSLNTTVYVVPGGLFAVPVIGNVKVFGPQMVVLPGFPIPTAGFDPTKTL